MNRALSHLRIVDLELFTTAAHLKNLSKAAILHHLSQSAASAAIQRVEAAFGCALCLHEKRQFQLTPEGNHLMPKMEAWLKQFKEIVVTTYTPHAIRLATTQTIARVVMPNILPVESIDLHLMRPDRAYEVLLQDAVDMALVLDNALWEGVNSFEVGSGTFGLYASMPDAPLGPVLLPENQREVLSLIQRWNQTCRDPLPIKSRIPSWSLIADLCCYSKYIGFLPDFLARRVGLHPVSWQPPVLHYRMLALYRETENDLQLRLNRLMSTMRQAW